jgi:Na+-transporting methylmalonyl-CoA/oxaloacetate decarboxylase gamma subunit
MRGDVLLLASDGLTDLVADPEILEIVRRRLPSGTAGVCHELVALANARGGHDNVTALVLSLIELPPQMAAHGTVIAGLTPTRGGTWLSEPKATQPGQDAAPAPTLFDDGSSRPRPTAPGLTQVDAGARRTEPGQSARPPRFSPDDGAPLPRPRPVSSSRLLVWLGVGLVLTVLLAIATWALVGVMHRRSAQSEEPVPPPEVQTHRQPRQVAPQEDAKMPPTSPSTPPPDAARDSSDSGS